MKISIICVGKIKERYWNMAIEEYLKRLNRYVNIKILEVSDEKLFENMSELDEDIIKKKEGEKILKNIKSKYDFCVLLDINGKNLDSKELANFIEEKTLNSVCHIIFIIGGSLGVSKEVFNRANYCLSFSKMTFTHQMMRVILLEQIYRVFKINKNEPYHK